jgi:hypothetical protein
MYGTYAGYYTNDAQVYRLVNSSLLNKPHTNIAARASFYITKYPTDNLARLFEPVNESQSARGGVYLASTGVLRVQDSTSTWRATTDAVPTNQWFHVWWSYESNGTDVRNQIVGFSTDETKPTSGDKYQTGQRTDAGDHEVTRFYAAYSTSSFSEGKMWVDGILVTDGSYADLPGAYPE